MRVGPATADERPVPAQDRLGGDEEGSPALPWHETGQGGDECPVGPRESGPTDLAAQDGQLVAEQEDLRLLGRGVHPMDTEQPEDATDESVEVGQCHGG